MRGIEAVNESWIDAHFWKLTQNSEALITQTEEIVGPKMVEINTFLGDKWKSSRLWTNIANVFAEISATSKKIAQAKKEKIIA